MTAQDLIYPTIRGYLGEALATVATWRNRVRARRALARIDERSLQEAGISPALAEYEMQQPFWRPLRNQR